MNRKSNISDELKLYGASDAWITMKIWEHLTNAAPTSAPTVTKDEQRLNIEKIDIFDKIEIKNDSESEVGVSSSWDELFNYTASGSSIDHSTMTVIELKDELRSKGCLVGGTKAVLIQRLKEYETSITK